MLVFYTGVIEPIQLSYVYDSLKLLNTFVKAAKIDSSMVHPLKSLMTYIDQKQDAISVGKRLRLLNLILSIIAELVSTNDQTRKLLTMEKIHQKLLSLLKSASKFISYNELNKSIHMH